MTSEEKSTSTTSGSQQAHKTKKSCVFHKVAKGLLVVLLIAMVVGSIRLELKGHRATKTHEEWDVYIKDHPFQRHDTDARGPCPMLNLLANHGLISRDGRNISKQELFDALMIVGAPPTITWMFLSTAVYPMYRDISPSDPFYANFLPAAYLNLDQLTIHNMIEHDVSLTRYDVDIPPHTDLSIPQPDLVRRIHDWAMLQQQFNNDNQVVLNMEGEHDLRKIRWFESFNDNPKSHLSLMYQISSSAECALLLDVIGRNGQLRADQIESLLLKEQFPHDWYPREKSMPAWQAVLRPMQCLYGLRNSKANLQSLDALQSDQ